MSELSALPIFVDVVRCRSFSRAAERHGVSQSAASQRVSQLEKSLGVKLLDRSVRPPALTEPGRVFFEGCAELVQRYDALTTAVRTHAEQDARKRVRVMAIYSAGIAWLGRVRATFAERHPGVSVSIEYGSPDAVRVALEHGTADVGIVSFPDRLFETPADSVASKNKNQPFAWRALRDEPLAVVCPVDHPWAREPSVSARHLSQTSVPTTGSDRLDSEMLAFDATLPVGAAVRDYLKQHGVTPRITHTFDNLDTLKAAVVGTGRPAILPRHCVAAEVAAGTLAAVALRPAVARPIAAVYRSEPAQEKSKTPDPASSALPGRSPWLDAFLDHLAEHAALDDGSPPTDATPPRPFLIPGVAAATPTPTPAAGVV